MTTTTRNRDLRTELKMFQLVAEDFEEANKIRHRENEYRFTQTASKKTVDWGQFNFEWGDLLRELFDG